VNTSGRQVVASALFALLAGAVVWPPVEGLLYWTALDALGDAVVVPVALVSVALGAGFARAYPVEPRAFTMGATGAYLLAMGVVRRWLAPDSPVHLVLYSAVLIGLAVGVGVVAARRDDDTDEDDEDERRGGEAAPFPSGQP